MLKGFFAAAAVLLAAAPAFAAPGSPMIGNLAVGMTREAVTAAYPTAWKGKFIESLPIGAVGVRSYLAYDDQGGLKSVQLQGYNDTEHAIEATLTKQYGDPRVEQKVAEYLGSREAASVLTWQKEGVSITLDKRGSGAYFLTYTATNIIAGL